MFALYVGGILAVCMPMRSCQHACLVVACHISWSRPHGYIRIENCGNDRKASFLANKVTP